MAERAGRQFGLIPPSADEVHPLHKALHTIQTAPVLTHYTIENAAEIAENEHMDPKNQARNESPCTLPPCLVDIKLLPDMKGLLRRKKMHCILSSYF